MATSNFDKIKELMQGYWRSAILFTAVHYKVFEWLGTKGMGAGILARKARVSERGAATLLDALAVIGLVSKKKGRYYNTAISKQFLMPEAKNYLGDSIKHYKNLWKLWGNLDEAVATGRGATPPKGHGSAAQTESFILAMENTARRRASQVLKIVGSAGVSKMLDVGGGPATYSIAFAKKSRKLQATVIDQHVPLKVARQFVKEAELHNRITLQEGDYFAIEFGTGYDLVLLSNVLHSMSPGRARLMINKSYGALVPGGRVVIHDFLPNEERTGPDWPILFAVNMLVATESGSTYTYGELSAWLRSGGFSEIKKVKVEDAGSTVVIAKKPRRRASSGKTAGRGQAPKSGVKSAAGRIAAKKGRGEGRRGPR
jgi:ubiquinone/menaquinone biosynthesis C-methylase UbiE